ncbi:MAG: TrbC/VirB2 family protein [Candidatus Gracilibacteria bacterium]|nr:TrbC/VirB2 family protein [Candidatus Gracilibacteria bacterium]
MRKKYAIYLLLILSLIFISGNVSASDAGTLFGVNKIDSSLSGGGSNLVATVNNIAGYIIGLFYFIAVILGIYGGFLILVSGGDEDKVKKGKNIIIYVVFGLIVIFLASQLVNWVIGIMTNNAIVGN